MRLVVAAAVEEPRGTREEARGTRGSGEEEGGEATMVRGWEGGEREEEPTGEARSTPSNGEEEGGDLANPMYGREACSTRCAAERRRQIENGGSLGRRRLIKKRSRRSPGDTDENERDEDRLDA